MLNVHNCVCFLKNCKTMQVECAKCVNFLKNMYVKCTKLCKFFEKFVGLNV